MASSSRSTSNLDDGHPKTSMSFTRLPKELVYFHRDEMNEWVEPDRIKDLEIATSSTAPIAMRSH